MPNKTIYIRKDDMEAYNKLTDKIPEIISKALKQEAGAKAKFEEVDTLLNGGTMVELVQILGEPIYARIDLRDEVRAKAKITELRSIIKDVLVGDTTEVHCELVNDHEDDGIDTHFSLKHDVAWDDGVSSHLWFKEKS